MTILKITTDFIMSYVKIFTGPDYVTFKKIILDKMYIIN